MRRGFFSNVGHRIELKCACNANGLKHLVKVVSELAAFSKVNFNIFVEQSTGTTPAISFPNTIVLSKKLLDQSSNVIAFVLAHEWGHQVFGHTTIPPYLRPTMGKQFDEDTADSYAAKFCGELGYDIADVYRFNALFFPQSEMRNEKIFLASQFNAPSIAFY